jgi:hypothetical protein
MDRGDRPDPSGHSADLMFFPVVARNAPDAETFRQLTKSHSGVFGPCDPFDGKEHGYMELGGWIGDQGLALQYMGLGALLGVFKLLTPKTVMPFLPPDLQMQMAGQGMVTIQAAKAEL